MYSVGCDIKQELSLVKNKIYRELIANKGIHVYQPKIFREFCISAGATDIFDAILDAITSTRHSAERINLNKKKASCVSYLQPLLLFQSGDWPCQFFCRQIIYQCVKEFISYQQPHQVNRENPQAASDHSAYCYPSFTGSDNEQSLPLNLSSQPSILSVIPIIGPLHMSLNSREHIVTSFHPFFQTVYEGIFTRSKLADKPKPWRISLLLEIVYGG